MEEPLLSSEKRTGSIEEESGKWSSYQYVGGTGSVRPTSSLAGTEVSVDEIRSAAAASGYYPPSLHGALVGSPEPDPIEQALVYQGGYGGDYGGPTPQFHRKILDEVEIRELLIDHVGHRCCWGSRPARTWRIRAVEDCNVYVGTLDTFIEEREVIRETEPYLGGSIDGKDNGPELGIWELDLRSQFPILFEPHKEVREKIPHSEVIEKCTVCAGRGSTVCATCNADQEPGFYKENQMNQCATCYGRGLIAHKDGSDTVCVKCNGKGKIPCVTCGSRGLIKCATCNGSGSLLARNLAIIRWYVNLAVSNHTLPNFVPLIGMRNMLVPSNHTTIEKIRKREREEKITHSVYPGSSNVDYVQLAFSHLANTLHASSIPMQLYTIQTSLNHCLGKKISTILLRVNLLQYYYLVFNLFSDEMVLDAYVLGPRMESWVFSQKYSTLTITPNNHISLCKAKLSTQSSQPNNFLDNMCQGHVLSLSSW